MHKLARLSQRTAGPTPSAVGLLAARLVSVLNRGQSTAVKHRTIATVLGLALIGAVAWINLATAHGLSFEFLYLFICTLVGWVAGTPGAFACTLASATVLYLDETATAPPGWTFICNSFIRFLAFASVGWLAAEVGRLTRNLGQTVEQHTTRLQHEVEHHKETARLLGEVAALFRQVTENITEVFWVTDPAKNNVEYVSPEFERLWGESCDTLYASPATWLQGIHHEDRQRVTQAMLTKQATGEYDEEYRVVRPDASLRWVHDRAFPVKDPAGAVYRIVGIAEDITERKRNEHLLQTQRDLGLALSSTSNLSFALDRLLGIALQLEGIDCGGVYLLDPGTGELHLHAHRGLSDPFIKRVSHYKADAAEARLVKAGEIVYVRNEQIPRNLEVLWGGEGLRALAVVPVQHKGSVLGMLTLASYRHDEIPPRARVGIELLASQVAGAIARIRAEEAQRRSEAHLRTVIKNAPIALIAADAQGIITFEDGQALAATGAKPGQHLQRPAAEVYAGFPLMLDNVRRALAGEGFSSVVEFDSTVLEYRFAPVRDNHKHPAGFIAVATDVTERFRLQREILEISDREQARIGQDVHDGLCQQLIGMAFNANSLERSLASEQRPEADVARKICGLLDEAITESRRVCRGLYPIRLTTQGLIPALEELAATTTERYNVHCTCAAEGAPPHCDVATSTHLYRIAQEAVNNALKHSGARHISLSLTADATATTLAIKDDGKGLAPAPKPNPGMGLHIMDYRARLIGGLLHLHSDSTGTTVSCRLAHPAR